MCCCLLDMMLTTAEYDSAQHVALEPWMHGSLWHECGMCLVRLRAVQHHFFHSGSQAMRANGLLFVACRTSVRRGRERDVVVTAFVSSVREGKQCPICSRAATCHPYMLHEFYTRIGRHKSCM